MTTVWHVFPIFLPLFWHAQMKMVIWLLAFHATCRFYKSWEWTHFCTSTLEKVGHRKEFVKTTWQADVILLCWNKRLNLCWHFICTRKKATFKTRLYCNCSNIFLLFLENLIAFGINFPWSHDCAQAKSCNKII